MIVIYRLSCYLLWIQWVSTTHSQLLWQILFHTSICSWVCHTSVVIGLLTKAISVCLWKALSFRHARIVQLVSQQILTSNINKQHKMLSKRPPIPTTVPSGTNTITGAWAYRGIHSDVRSRSEQSHHLPGALHPSWTCSNFLSKTRLQAANSMGDYNMGAKKWTPVIIRWVLQRKSTQWWTVINVKNVLCFRSIKPNRIL